MRGLDLDNEGNLIIPVLEWLDVEPDLDLENIEFFREERDFDVESSREPKDIFETLIVNKIQLQYDQNE